MTSNCCSRATNQINSGTHSRSSMEDITNLQINITCQCHKSSLTFVSLCLCWSITCFWHFTDCDLDNWWVQHVGQEMLTRFRNTWFHFSHIFIRLVHVVIFNWLCQILQSCCTINWFLFWRVPSFTILVYDYSKNKTTVCFTIEWVQCNCSVFTSDTHNVLCSTYSWRMSVQGGLSGVKTNPWNVQLHM